MLILALLPACNFTTRSTESGEANSTEAFVASQTGTFAEDYVPDLSPTPTATATPTPTPTETPIPLVYPVGPSGFPTNVSPLTGLVVDNMQWLERRPLAIKVSNFPRSARPQAGLSRADLLWEFYTEFGNTRWVAMYYGQEAEKVGPIRSARVLDTRLVPHYDAILVHVQAFETVWEEISKSGIDTINEFPASCPAICRDPDEEFVENSAFGNTAELTKYSKRIGVDSGVRPDLNGMVFDPAPPADAPSAVGARIYFSSSATAQWKYDEESNRYLRYSEDDVLTLVPLDDRTTGSQLAVDNVIVLIVDIFTYAGKTGTGEQLDMDLNTSGKAFFFRDGMIVQGTWKSVGPNVPLQFEDSQGNAYALHPGSTYFAIVGKRNIGAAAATTEWHFYVPS
ncbi:MAG: DUF3048 domain-containing protein [Anaerolineales bacterium]